MHLSDIIQSCYYESVPEIFATTTHDFQIYPRHMIRTTLQLKLNIC